MAILKSAKKALRQSLRRKKRNLVYKNKLRDLIKKIRVSGDKNLLPQLYQALDKAAKVGIIKKNTAARNKSRIARLVNKPEHAN